MTTDFQQARQALGARLRELRGGKTQRELAGLLGWPQAKVSKLETGRQSATAEDLMAWAKATGHPEATEELIARLQGLETNTRSWRRQLSSGHRPVQDVLTIEYERSTVLRAWQGAMVVGILQTADYARHVFTRYAQLQSSPRDVEDAVRARIRRQQLLFEPGREFHILMWEAALHAGVCPPDVLAGQLEKLASFIGLDTVRLGIVPFGAQLGIPPANGFWLYDDRLAITEDWHAELWLNDADSVALYQRVWDTLDKAAVYGTNARRLIGRARAQFSDLA
ncbi:helix-turn-helix domain-containing protein [Streptomyces phaeochromogenes]|uniref:helix-turn-helix domain-containing protein n=1 Tax=Streptomyces phaeochromogenes TaxID=1923 RepID=UPI00387035F4|nr:helix-turn-helix transcriptional regulator [Streptomyces phaeochromogenes]